MTLEQITKSLEALVKRYMDLMFNPVHKLSQKIKEDIKSSMTVFFKDFELQSSTQYQMQLQYKEEKALQLKRMENEVN
jgi:hypothetical protein